MHLAATAWANTQALTNFSAERWPHGIAVAQTGGGTAYVAFSNTCYQASCPSQFASYRTSADDGATWAAAVTFGYDAARTLCDCADVRTDNSYLALDATGNLRAFWDMEAGGGLLQSWPDAYPRQLFFRDLPSGPIAPLPPARDELSQAGDAVPWTAFTANANVATGNFALPETDVAIPGRGMGLVFTRTYNTAGAADGPLGYGWTHTYASRLTSYPDGKALVIDASGRWDLYTPATGGGYTAPPGLFTPSSTTATAPGR